MYGFIRLRPSCCLLLPSTARYIAKTYRVDFPGQPDSNCTTTTSYRNSIPSRSGSSCRCLEEGSKTLADRLPTGNTLASRPIFYTQREDGRSSKQAPAGSQRKDPTGSRSQCPREQPVRRLPGAESRLVTTFCVDVLLAAIAKPRVLQAGHHGVYVRSPLEQRLGATHHATDMLLPSLDITKD